jgi:hypothetical protein
MKNFKAQYSQSRKKEPQTLLKKGRYRNFNEIFKNTDIQDDETKKRN